MKVVIVNQDRDYCLLLRSVLVSIPSIESVSSWPGSSASLVHSAATPPDLAFVELETSGPSARKFVDDLRASWPSTVFVMVTSRIDVDSILGALQGGASGYLLRDTQLTTLPELVDQVRRGGCPMSPRAARQVVEWFHDRLCSAAEPMNLSSREKQILAGVAEGGQNSVVAASLHLSEATVRAHLRRIYEKLHVHSRAEAAARLSGQTDGATHNGIRKDR